MVVNKNRMENRFKISFCGFVCVFLCLWFGLCVNQGEEM